MASTSQVASGLDSVAARIANQRAAALAAVKSAQAVVAALNAIPTDYADLITTINGYGTTDAFEAFSKAELAKLTAEFGALLTAAETIAAVQV